MKAKVPSVLAVLGFASAIAMFVVTFTDLLSFPLHRLSVPALTACSIWLAVGFWFCARGMVTVRAEAEKLRQLARFGLYIHGIVLFASGMGLAA